MPSPVVQGRHSGKKYYRRKDGAYIYDQKKGYVKVGGDKYKDRKHFALRNLSSDQKRSARKGRKTLKKSGQKAYQRYPQAYDKPGRKW